jgi:hypothetical protein
VRINKQQDVRIFDIDLNYARTKRKISLYLDKEHFYHFANYIITEVIRELKKLMRPLIRKFFVSRQFQNNTPTFLHIKIGLNDEMFKRCCLLYHAVNCFETKLVQSSNYLNATSKSSDPTGNA